MLEKNLIPGLFSRMWKLNDNNLLVLGWYQTGFFHYYTTRLTLIKMCLTTVMFGQNATWSTIVFQRKWSNLDDVRCGL
jgi:hypothetical protein